MIMSPANAAGVVTGELKQWHRVTLTFDGPATSEDAATNPFRNYRLLVTFTKGTRSLVLPGFYAADGDSANTGATSGNKWRVHFRPDEQGTWSYRASFRTGTDIAVSTDPSAGTATSFDGATGSIAIGPTDKAGRDFRAQGRLDYVGKHHLRFAGSGRYFIKGGAGSPENFLAYQDFDGTFDAGTSSIPGDTGLFLHSYGPHAGDWRSGDPTWQGGKGKNIMGALNYLSNKGVNSLYFVTFNKPNSGGDGQDVWPWTNHTERHRFDSSKLDQWEIVFSHMEARGILMHLFTQEIETGYTLNSGTLGFERKLYYRELIARFGHHLGLVWNLGEENTNTDAARKSFADYIRALDPYDHPVVMHNPVGAQENVFGPLVGHPTFEGTSLQMSDKSSSHAETIKWIGRSAASGRKWLVSVDEIGGAGDGVVPDSVDPAHNAVRKQVLWGNLMAGGFGTEWYFGYNHAHNDLRLEDFRSRENMWDQTRHALDFFNQHLPYADMTHADTLTSATHDYVLAKAGQTYAVYLPTGGTTDLNLSSAAGTFTVNWYNPRAGGPLQTGSVATVSGGGTRALGNPPADPTSDWVVLITNTPGTGSGGTPVPDGGTPDPGAGTPDPGAGTPDPGAGTPAPGGGTTDPTPPAGGGCAVPTGGGAGGLKGTYFDDQNLSVFKLSRTDPTVDFQWGSGSPDPTIAPDTFSARWIGQIVPRYSDTYTFHVFSNDGVRLWVDGTQLINNWTHHVGEDSKTMTRPLVAGQKYDIKLEHFEGSNTAASRLYWSSPRQGKEIVPASQLYPGATTDATTPCPPADGAGTTPPDDAASPSGNHLDDTATLTTSMGQWVDWYATTPVRSGDAYKSAPASLKIEIARPYGWGVSLRNWPGFAATAGNKRLSFWGMSGSAGADLGVKLFVKWKDATGMTTLGSDEVTLDLTQSWRQAEVDVVAPAGTARVWLELVSAPGKRGRTGDVLYVDDFYVGNRP